MRVLVTVGAILIKLAPFIAAKSAMDVAGLMSLAFIEAG